MDYIGLISPYTDLAELGKKHQLKVEIADGYDALPIANRLISEGVEVIISRGGTALILKENVAVPVVSIQTTALEVLKAIKLAKETSDKIGICGYNNIVTNIDDIQKLLDVDLIPVIISKDDPNEVKKNKIGQLLGKVNVMVGDNISVMFAKEFGLEGILIATGEDSLIQSVYEANRIVAAIKDERTRYEELNVILNHCSDGIINTNTDNRIKFFNPAAEKIFKITREEACGRKLEEVFPYMNLHEAVTKDIELKDELYNVGKKLILGSTLPIKFQNETTGAVCILKDASEIQNQEEKIRRKIYLQGHVAKYTFDEMVSGDAKMDELIKTAKLYARTDSNVLLMGETGTGKEFFAQGIHNESKRREKPFVAVNCAALPDSLLESELFGYDEGAFTGAKKGGKKGLFEIAHGGTIFLDEIGEIALHIQTRLLRVLQEKQIMRVGSDRVIPIDVRIIAATNADLMGAIKERKFREDLFYRLNVLSLNVIPLRERKASIPLLANKLIRHYCKINEIGIKTITQEALTILQGYNWPGNIRELQNIMERLAIIVEEALIEKHHVQSILKNIMNDDGREPQTPKVLEPYLVQIKINKPLKEIETDIIAMALEICGGNKTKVADMLKIGRATIWRRYGDNM
jgi:PAS domain S-box-containing protein